MSGPIRHGLPSEAVYNALVASGAFMTFDLQYMGLTGSSNTITRNGGTGFANAGSQANLRMTRLRYCDPATGQPMEMNPFAGTGPTPYTLGT